MNLINELQIIITYFLYFATTVAVLSGCVKICPQGQELNIERFGKYLRTQPPGITFLIPLMDRVAYRVSTKEASIVIGPIECITSDNASVTCSAVTFVRTFNSKSFSYNVEDAHAAIDSLSISTLRSAIGEMTLDATLSNRDSINTKILTTLTPAGEEYGVKVNRCEMTEITPAPVLVDSMAQQVVAERDRRSMTLNADAKKESEVKIAEGEKSAEILRAQAVLESAKLEAEAIERKGEAEAKAVESLNKALSGDNNNAANYFLGQSYITAFSKLAESDNNKLVMLPTNVSSSMGSIAGIAEMLSQQSNK